MALRVAFSSSWHGEAINRDASFAENYKSGRSLSEEIAPNRHGSEPHGLLARFSHTVAVVVVADFPPPSARSASPNTVCGLGFGGRGVSALAPCYLRLVTLGSLVSAAHQAVLVDALVGVNGRFHVVSTGVHRMPPLSSRRRVVQ